MVWINIKSLYVVIEVCRVVLAPQNSAGKENPGFSNQKREHELTILICAFSNVK